MGGLGLHLKPGLIRQQTCDDVIWKFMLDVETPLYIVVSNHLHNKVAVVGISVSDMLLRADWVG